MKQNSTIWLLIRDFLRDCGVILLEAALLIIMALSPWLFKIQLTINPVSKPEEIVWFVASSAGKLSLCVALFAFWLLAIRKYNENAVLNSTSAYHNYPFFFYRLAAFFGYKKCILVGTPIHLQIRVVMHQLFENYPSPQILNEEDKSEEETKVMVDIYTVNPQDMEINLLVADTYDITEDQIPPKCKELHMIKINHNGKFGVRMYRPQLIQKVVETMNELPEGCIVNYFATTNPKNQEQITLQAFMQFGRGRIRTLNIYQQESEEPRVFKKKVTIKGV